MYQIKTVIRGRLPYGTFQYCIELNIHNLILKSDKVNFYLLNYGRPTKITSKKSLKISNQMIESRRKYIYGAPGDIYFNVDQFMFSLNSLCVGKIRFIGNPQKTKRKMGRLYFTDFHDVVTLGFMDSDIINSVKKYTVLDCLPFSTKEPKTTTNIKWFIEVDDQEYFFDSYKEASITAKANNVKLFQTISIT